MYPPINNLEPKIASLMLVKNGSEELVKVHVSSYLLPETMRLESVQSNQKHYLIL
jgi:hypothetical protein